MSNPTCKACGGSGEDILVADSENGCCSYSIRKPCYKCRLIIPVEKYEAIGKALQEATRIIQGFAETAEAAVAHHEWTLGPKKGMQVPFHGDFANVVPSTVSRLRWWATEFRAVLTKIQEIEL